MRWSDRVTLVPQTQERDPRGVLSQVDGTPREVFCNPRTASSADQFAAEQAGLRVSCILELHAEDYGDERVVEWHGDRLPVTLVAMSGRSVRITCARKAGV
jgi:hypothetical protein